MSTRASLLVDARRALSERDPARADEIMTDVERWASPEGADLLVETELASSTRVTDLELLGDSLRACFPDRGDGIFSELQELAARRLLFVGGLLRSAPRAERMRAAAALGSCCEAAAITPLLERSTNADEELHQVCRTAVLALLATLETGVRQPILKRTRAKKSKKDELAVVDVAKKLIEMHPRGVVPLAAMLGDSNTWTVTRYMITDYFALHPDARANDALLAAGREFTGDYQLFALTAMAATADPRAVPLLIDCAHMSGRGARPIATLTTLLEKSAARIADADLEALESLGSVTESVFNHDDDTGGFFSDTPSYAGEEDVAVSALQALAAAERKRRAGGV